MTKLADPSSSATAPPAGADPLAELTRQIELLAQASTVENVFFPEFLRRLATLEGVVGGIVWSRGMAQRPEPAYGINLTAVGLKGKPEAERLNEQLVSEVLASGVATLIGPGGKTQKTPTSHSVALAPLQKGKQAVGIVELFLQPEITAAAAQVTVQTLDELCGYASRYLRQREELAAEPAPAEAWQEFRRFTLDLQRSLLVDEVAATAANDGRRLVRCDRASVAVCRGRQTAIVAVSGQDSVNRKANLIQLLEKLTRCVVEAGEPLIYSGKLDDLPPQIEQPLAEYMQESGSRFVMITPLFQSEPLVGPDPEKAAATPARKIAPRPVPVGAMIIEQIAESHPRPGVVARAELAARHVAASLTNALAYQRIFLLPLWRTIGTAQEALRGRTLLRIMAGLGATALIIAALAWTPWTFKVTGEGRLMPIVRQQVFATADGVVEEVLVESGSLVTAGTPLVKLRNKELETRLTSARNDLSERRQLITSLRAEENEALRSGSREEAVQVQGKIAQTQIEIQGALARIQLLEEQEAQLIVTAPIDGQITTFQVQQILQNRPVRRGESLLELMDTRRGWQLELDVPEYRLGHMLRAQHARSEGPLPVQFSLATNSEARYDATLARIASRSVVGESGSMVQVLGAIAPEELRRMESHAPAGVKTESDPVDISLRIGTEVRARVDCGQRSLGYVLFGELLEFVQTRWWF